MTTTYDFPQDLRDAQIALHQTRAEYEQYAKTLPVVPRADARLEE
ncbi:hypothetical protein [Streptomyces sp. NPDC058620]